MTQRSAHTSATTRGSSRPPEVSNALIARTMPSVTTSARKWFRDSSRLPWSWTSEWPQGSSCPRRYKRTSAKRTAMPCRTAPASRRRPEIATLSARHGANCRRASATSASGDRSCGSTQAEGSPLAVMSDLCARSANAAAYCSASAMRWRTVLPRGFLAARRLSSCVLRSRRTSWSTACGSGTSQRRALSAIASPGIGIGGNDGDEAAAARSWTSSSLVRSAHDSGWAWSR